MHFLLILAILALAAAQKWHPVPGSSSSVVEKYRQARLDIIALEKKQRQGSLTPTLSNLFAAMDEMLRLL